MPFGGLGGAIGSIFKRGRKSTSGGGGGIGSAISAGVPGGAIARAFQRKPTEAGSVDRSVTSPNIGRRRAFVGGRSISKSRR